jgi:predicted nucleic acid-binding protein
LNAYLDTSVLVSMLTVDDNTRAATAWLSSAPRRLSLSDWSVTEFSSALALGVRTGRLTQADRTAAEVALRSRLDVDRQVEAVVADDVRTARALILATGLPLRAGDALHLAIAQRLGDAVATFDARMREAAVDLGLRVEDLSPHA